MKPGTTIPRLVTLQGEYFDLECSKCHTPLGSKASSYHLVLTDRIGHRGKRWLIIHISNEVQRAIEDLRTDFDSFLVNRVRRAFDGKEITFDVPQDINGQKEIFVDYRDIAPKPPMSDSEIEQFLIQKAYWCGLSRGSKVEMQLIPFDTPADLDYLQIHADDIKRHIQILKQRKLLDKNLGGMARPTRQLIELYEMKTNNSVQRAAPQILTNPALMDIFISHSSHDIAIVKELVELLRSALPQLHPDRIRCTSLDGYKLKGGTYTDIQLRDEVVKGSRAFIGVLTKHSLQSTYVLFELGARWGAGLLLTPLVAAGLPISSLRAPLCNLHVHSCNSESDLHQLLDEMSECLDFKPARAAIFDDQLKRLVQLSKAASRRPTESVGIESEIIKRKKN